MFVTMMKLWKSEDGATAIEYGLIAALIAVAAKSPRCSWLGPASPPPSITSPRSSDEAYVNTLLTLRL